MNTTVRSSIVIDRPPEDIVRIFIDPEKAPLWNTGLERFEVLSAAPGLVGSRARLHFVQGARRYVMEDELLEVEPERRYLSRVSGDMLEAEVETLLTPVEVGTLVTVRWTGSGKKPLLRVLLPLMRRSVARQTMVDLAKLKKLAESR
jgi:uncharacterized protein YndB with AHSA1/START domain